MVWAGSNLKHAIRRARLAYATITDADSSSTADDATDNPNNDTGDDSHEEEEQ